MRLGVAIRECVRGTDDDILRAVDAWAEEAGAMPKLLPLWRSLQRTAHLGAPSNALVGGLWARGVEPIIYLESAESRASFDGYVRLLRGELDHLLGGMGGLIVRFDPEVNGGWAPWARAPRYIDAFRHVARVSVARMLWTPQAATPRHWAQFADWWPGDDAVTAVGFDRYDLGGRRKLPRAWAGPIASIRRLTDAPIIVGEFGADPRNGYRGRWLRSLADVQGVHGAVYLDIDLRRADPAAGIGAEGRSWLMDPPMRQEYGGLIRRLA